MFFAAINHLRGPLWKRKFSSAGSSVGCDLGRFRSILFASVFQGSLAVAILVIDGSEKRNRHFGFQFQSAHVIERRN